jgi:hypothetical protein
MSVATIGFRLRKLPKVIENGGIDRENVFQLTFRSHSASGTMGFFGETS